MAAGNQAEGVPAPEVRAERSKFDAGVAHSARVYDYWLGGCFRYAHSSQRTDHTAVPGHHQLTASLRRYLADPRS